MLTIHFDKTNMRRDNPSWVRYQTRSRSDDGTVQLVSIATGVSVMMHYDATATQKYWMEAEGWDGEWDCELYSGLTAAGRRVTLELGNTPYDEE